MPRTAHHQRCLQHLRPAIGALMLFVLVGVAGAGDCQGLTKGADLEFGMVVPLSGGTVTVTPYGVRSATGAALPITLSGVTPSAATFTVSGTADATYAITLPPDGTVALTDGQGHSMAVDGFTSSPDETGVLSGGSPGTQTLRVGATLHLSAQQPVGQYTGDYDVIVAFN